MGHISRELLSPTDHSAPAHSGQSTEGSVSQTEGLWKGLVEKLIKPTQLQWKKELSGSRAENYLDDRVLYKLFIGMSLDAVERTLELVTRVLRRSPSHNITASVTSGKPPNPSESQFPQIGRAHV